MPLEIKELHIRVNVDNSTAASGQATGSNSSTASTEPDPALVQACVEKVLEVLTKKNER